jgi:hypothetical protein
MLAFARFGSGRPCSLGCLVGDAAPLSRRGNIPTAGFRVTV